MRLSADLLANGLNDDYLARPAAESRHGGCVFCFCFFKFLLTTPVRLIKCQHLVYRNDHRQIFRTGRTVAVCDQSEISFSILQGTLLWRPSFDGFVHKT